MQNRTSRELFDLVKSLTKCEKKSFNRYAKRNSNSESLNVLVIFRVLNSMEQYDEKLLVRKMKGVQCQQLPSLKGHLYNQILDSLRIGKNDESILLQLHQLMEHANILYAKGFVVQAGKVLKRLKNLASSRHQVSFLFQALVMEKKIELIYGSCEQAKIKSLNNEMQACSHQLQLMGQMSNQSMLLFGLYKKYGSVTNTKEEENVDAIYGTYSKVDEESLSFYPKLYFFQAKTYYYLLRSQTNLFFQSAKCWVDLFSQYPDMAELELVQFQRGASYLNEAAFQLQARATLVQSAELLKRSPDLFYPLLAKINFFLFEKHYDASLIDQVYMYGKSLQNPERQLRLCYKAAQLCLVGNDHGKVLDFTLLGLNQKSEARIDLQFKLRLMQVEAHNKLSNFRITDYLELSTHRFAKRNGLLNVGHGLLSP
ncbi:hypothetical protein [Flavisolibacter ginsenosidimutans]|uniref:Uncharacterized protein n=1 Tax=Flavisolibacter ginsenosidimutans TaxID=661481 RepID=A0A5B8UIU3_9BACT|nr:hypothetical protein [Flavisolibacter ginsenosidimutans]QEC56306.1 hypothetical protein FSB75_10510 [Flavisolibacter ginsenosidimutans]